MTASLVIRPFRPGDERALTDICLRTGAAGTDATDEYASRTLLGDVYAVPYARHDPTLALVVDAGPGAGAGAGAGPVGYALATADTRAFAAWFTASWWPEVRPREVTGRDAALVASADRPDRLLIADVDAYPAHLHIDLLPEAQGQGVGRRIMDALLDLLRERGVPAVHLGLDPANTGAGVFYERLGFHRLVGSDPTGSVRGMIL